MGSQGIHRLLGFTVLIGDIQPGALLLNSKLLALESTVAMI